MRRRGKAWAELNCNPDRAGLLFLEFYQTILDRAASGRLDVKPVVVVASRVCRGLELARQAGVPGHLVVKRDFPDVESYSGPIPAIFENPKLNADETTTPPGSG